MEQAGPPRGGMVGVYERENQLFERVWPRVDGRGAAETPEAAAQAGDGALRQAIDGELADWRTYALLAARGRAAGLFSRLAREEMRHARRLAAAYFTERAIRYFPRRGARGERYPDEFEALRARILHEREGEAAYRRMAQTAQEPLRALLLELAAEEAAHALALTALLESRM